LNENPKDCLNNCGMRVLVRIPSTSSIERYEVRPLPGPCRHGTHSAEGSPARGRSSSDKTYYCSREKAIPLLIACLPDETATKESVMDFWPTTTVGDIAFFYLCDLFTDSTWQHSTIVGVVTFQTVAAEYPDSPSWDGWVQICRETRQKLHSKRLDKKVEGRRISHCLG
jgi:hypothetical protein